MRRPPRRLLLALPVAKTTQSAASYPAPDVAASRLDTGISGSKRVANRGACIEGERRVAPIVRLKPVASRSPDREAEGEVPIELVPLEPEPAADVEAEPLGVLEADDSRGAPLRMSAFIAPMLPCR